MRRNKIVKIPLIKFIAGCEISEDSININVKPLYELGK